MISAKDERINNLSISNTLKIPVINSLNSPPVSSNLAIKSATSNLIVSNGMMWYPLLPSQTFIYRPNYVGPPLPNTYTSWHALYSDIILIQGIKIIMFVNDKGKITIPISKNKFPYYLKNAIFFQPLCINMLSGPNTIDVIIEDGVQFSGCCRFDGPINFHVTSKSVPVMISGSPTSSPEPIIILDNAFTIMMDSGATQPFLRISNNIEQAILFGNFSNLVSNAEISAIDVQGTLITLINGSSISIQPNTISGSGGSSVWGIQIYNKSALTLSLASSSYKGIDTFTVDDASQLSSALQRFGTPTPKDDASQGIFLGTIWLNKFTKGVAPNTYICSDNTVGAAIWTPLN